MDGTRDVTGRRAKLVGGLIIAIGAAWVVIRSFAANPWRLPR